MDLPKNYVFVTSMNTRLYNHSHNLFTKSVPIKYPNHRIMFYHENSFDTNNYKQSINLNDLNKYDNIELYDLFLENNWLESFLKNSQFKNCYMSKNYYIKNSPFWFRKVVTICDAINRLEHGDVMIWADCDSYIEKELPNDFYNYLSEYDWLCIMRKNDWIETGFQFININDKTKSFGKFYLDYYLSGNVFDEQPEWADNWVLEACFKNYTDSLKYGGLTPEFGCPININQFIVHSKQPLASVRANEKI